MRPTYGSGIADALERELYHALLEKRLKATGLKEVGELTNPKTEADHRGTGYINRKRLRDPLPLVDWRRLCLGTRFVGNFSSIADHKVVFEGSLWARLSLRPGRYGAVLVTNSRRLIRCTIAITEKWSLSSYWHTYFYALWRGYEETAPDTLENLCRPT